MDAGRVRGPVWPAPNAGWRLRNRTDEYHNRQPPSCSPDAWRPDRGPLRGRRGSAGTVSGQPPIKRCRPKSTATKEIAPGFRTHSPEYHDWLNWRRFTYRFRRAPAYPRMAVAAAGEIAVGGVKTHKMRDLIATKRKWVDPATTFAIWNSRTCPFASWPRATPHSTACFSVVFDSCGTRVTKSRIACWEPISEHTL